MKWAIQQILFFSHLVHSMINLFISKTEMDRTLGLDVQLNYIENGIINLYSVKFPYRINNSISYVQFSWNTKVHYTIRLISYDSAVMPLLQIPSSGKVPLKLETFNIEYRCAGIKTGKFDIQVNFNFDWPSDTNQTNVSLKHEKLCTARALRRAYSVALISAENIFYLVIGCVGAVVLVIALIILVYYRSIKKSSHSVTEPVQLLIPKSQNPTEKISANVSETHLMISESAAKAAVYAGPNKPYSSFNFRPSNVPVIIYEKSHVINIKKAFKGLYVDRNFFKILSVEELEGTFGEMKWAIWKKDVEHFIGDVDDQEDNVCFEERVILKTLKLTADQRHLKKFLEEALAFFSVERHENLAQVAAIASSCDDLNDPEQIIDFPLICYSHDGFGNLKKFLINCRNGQKNAQFKNPDGNGIQTLGAHELVSMALQILNAVIYLHNFGIIHKDIATRNCLVSRVHNRDNLFVQICDSALSKDFFPDDYHCLGDNENRPMKWMAHESLVHNSFNSSTDVWSFGVTLWELLTCAQQPYPDIDPDEMAVVLERGKRLSQPYSCPDELYGLLYCCWQLDYRDRPTTQQLLIALQEFNLELLQYI
ncbi:unnamed protein product [Cercopithifilaria johnstoni]|uniref:Tyrosine-protein kinase RYK n=1 Tax=Cercopithifilaria johnstoni TaxID=2874296 RepID=A0A8J2PSP0_9BILA|nr:unnamed protein product [Cercopithifilaria johnstoni]